MAQKNILFFSLEDWDEVWRRNQFICAYLHNRHPDSSILWVSPQRQLSALRSVSQLTPAKLSNFSNIFTIGRFKLLPNSLGRWLNDWITGIQVSSAIKELAWQDFSIWVNDQSARTLVPRFPGKSLVYDITDDWTENGQPKHIRTRTANDDRWLLKHADQVIVCSRRLFDLKHGLCRSLSLIPNGAETDRYAPEILAQLTRPSDISHLRRPIAGYTGTLHEDRLDVELVMAVARQLPFTQFLFVGPNCLKPSASDRLRNLPNVHLIGARPYQDLPPYLASMDVLIVPHKITPFTESLDPLKLYEFFSTGKPIVSTPCAGFREMGELVSQAQDASDFAQKVSESLKHSGGDSSRHRVQWASRHTWPARAEQIERLLGWNQ